MLKLERKRSTKDWDDDLFLVNLNLHLQRSSTADMKTADWRLLMVKFERIILPSIKTLARKDQMRKFCQLWCELQWIAYLLPAAQRKRGVQLRLFYVTFNLTKMAKQLWGESVMNNYLHSIFVHWAPYFTKRDFRNSSTEQGEAWLAFLKRVFRSYTNRRPDEALLELLHRMHDEAEVQDLTGARKRQEKKMGKIKVEFQRSYVFQEVSSPANGDTAAFLDYLRTFGFSDEKGDWNEQIIKDPKNKNKEETVLMFNTLLDVQYCGGKVKK